MNEPRTIPGNFCVVHKYHWPKPARTVKHHIEFIGDGGKDAVENEVLVCDTGHYNIHEYADWLKGRRKVEPKVTRKEKTLAQRGYSFWLAQRGKIA